MQAKPCRDFRDVFENVKLKTVAAGVVPVENSLEGSINQNYDLFFNYDLKVCGEVIVRIDHCLIANPGTRMDQIKVGLFSSPSASAMPKLLRESRMGNYPRIRYRRQRKNHKRRKTL